ncbi:putative gpi anchored cell wall protein [Rosellinia necatrix]|uniref:Putative gpi anchored cell wall protein n=1 Tax=Rosellinia necatrix TaxID=77044 RepID=A0A1W2TMM9_ROSNE|nr:putative gpi anchored cell wall protein [Rosellinia necatrix]
MKPFITTLLAGVVANAGAVLRLRQSDDACCFGLSSVGILDEEVKEDHLGGLSLGGPFQQGGFCFDKSTKTIKDALNHNCFMRDPAQQFQCYVGIVGATAFEISAPDLSGKSYLTYDNGFSTFHACPVGTGDSRYYNIFSAVKPNTTGCVSVGLALYDASTGCASAANTRVATRTLSVRKGRASYRSTQLRKRVLSEDSAAASSMPGYIQAPTAGVLSNMSPSPSAGTDTAPKISLAKASYSAKPSHTCSISPSAPSIAPIKVVSVSRSDSDNTGDSSAEVSITSHNSTTFLYGIPYSFLPPVNGTKMPLCALQFRMPVCMDLPKGYPCYKFSGLEQEFLSDSGMNFDLIIDDGQAAWNGTVLHQVTPGENMILGTFECGMPNGSYGTRKMSWRVSSVRNFSLEFLHAGVGSHAKFQDGIGAWIVPCE